MSTGDLTASGDPSTSTATPSASSDDPPPVSGSSTASLHNKDPLEECESSDGDSDTEDFT